MHAPMPDTALSASRWAMVGRIRLCLCGVSAVVGILSMPTRHLGPRRWAAITATGISAYASDCARHAQATTIGAYACIGQDGSPPPTDTETWRTKVPVVEAHIPAATAGRRSARSPTRCNQSLVQGLGIAKATASSMITKHAEDELFVGATFMNMSWGPDAIIITVGVG